MNSLKEIVKDIKVLKYFKSDGAKLIALSIIVIATICLSSTASTQSLLIMGIFAIIIQGMKLWFDFLKHKAALEADVEKAKLYYKTEEEKHRTEQKLL